MTYEELRNTYYAFLDSYRNSNLFYASLIDTVDIDAYPNLFKAILSIYDLKGTSNNREVNFEFNHESIIDILYRVHILKERVAYDQYLQELSVGDYIISKSSHLYKVSKINLEGKVVCTPIRLKNNLYEISYKFIKIPKETVERLYVL